MINASSWIAGKPWLIQAEALQQIAAIVERESVHALATREGPKLEYTRTTQRRGNGVAVVPITGPIFRNANLFTDISGATSTQVLATDLQTAIDDPSVKSIVLNIDSPGGEATGINELAQMIFAARGRKPIKAYIGGTGASAAYWLASAADSITIDPTAVIGSIGVVMSVTDSSARDEKAGVKNIDIVSSQSPNKRLGASTEAGRAQAQTVVDALADVFVSAVARNRSVSTSKVVNDFGKGGVVVGIAAIKAGMADGIGSLESVIAGRGPASPSTQPHLSYQGDNTHMQAGGVWDTIVARATARISPKSRIEVTAESAANATAAKVANMSEPWKTIVARAIDKQQAQISGKKAIGHGWDSIVAKHTAAQ